MYWQDAVGRMVEQGLDITADEKVDVVAFLAAQQESPSVSEAIGQFHFLMLHFPIVLIVVVGVAELWRLRHGAPLCRDTLHALVRLAVVTTVLTILFGLTLVSEWGTKPALLEWHRDAGLLTGACVIVAWLFRERAVRAQATFAAKGYRVALWAALLAVGLTGHLGGTLVHGDPLAGLLDHLR